MSTKKRLLEVVKKITAINKQETKAASQIAAYEIAQDLPKLTSELARLYEELERKQNTPITKELLEKNEFRILTQSVSFPFITWKLEAHPNFWFDEYKEDRKYLDDGTFGLVKKGSYLLGLASTRTDLKTVTDLEDALDLACIDKDIEICKNTYDSLIVDQERISELTFDERCDRLRATQITSDMSHEESMRILKIRYGVK